MLLFTKGLGGGFNPRGISYFRPSSSPKSTEFHKMGMDSVGSTNRSLGPNEWIGEECYCTCRQAMRSPDRCKFLPNRCIRLNDDLGAQRKGPASAEEEGSGMGRSGAKGGADDGFNALERRGCARVLRGWRAVSEASSVDRGFLIFLTYTT